jgi:methyl-accepting chemotaxis protein
MAQAGSISIHSVDDSMLIFFRPAFFILARLSTGAGFAVAGVLFVLPLIAVGALASSAADGGRAVSWPLLVALALPGIYCLCALYLWMRSGMRRLNRLVERVASGDLSYVADPNRVGVDRSAGDRLWRAVAQMNANLVEIVTQVRRSADAIASMAAGIADDAANLSQRTQEQGASLEETASSMEELSATVKQNADNCAQATALASSASGVASKAAHEMQGVAQTMLRIDESAHRVAEILGVIEGIAFQTNILALNAAIEAARAGEQGRGFAVVAAEVRSLAQRSADAAKQIKTLIEASVDSAVQGRQWVEASAGTMSKVVQSVQQVADVIGRIALASSEQSAGVDDINRAIAQLDAVTHQNAALVEQSATTAHAFEVEAGRLVDVVGTFKLDRIEERDRAVEMVKRAVAHIHAKGMRQACEDFNDPRGQFIDGDCYIWAGDFKGIVAANASNPDSRGQDHYELKAADGKKFIQEIIRTAQTKGKGWCDYLWKNPKTGRTEVKSTYFEAVDNIFIACGIYKGKSAQARKPLTQARGAIARIR